MFTNISTYAHFYRNSGCLSCNKAHCTFLSPCFMIQGKTKSTRGRGAGWRGGEPREAEDSEMRDVRRDGLIEALLIAFTPPRGLLYLSGVSIVSTFFRRIRAEVVFWRTPFPIFLLHRRPSSPFFPLTRPLLYSLPSSSRLASPCLSFALDTTLFAPSFLIFASLFPSFFLFFSVSSSRRLRRIIPPLSPK